MNKISLIILLIGFAFNSQNLKAQVETIPSNNPEAQLKSLGIILPTPSTPVANYVQAVRTGNLLW